MSNLYFLLKIPSRFHIHVFKKVHNNTGLGGARGYRRASRRPAVLIFVEPLFVPAVLHRGQLGLRQAGEVPRQRWSTGECRKRGRPPHRELRAEEERQRGQFGVVPRTSCCCCGGGGDPQGVVDSQLGLRVQGQELRKDAQ